MGWARQVSKAFFAFADIFAQSPLGPRILIYHQIGAGTGAQMDLAVEDFDWQMHWLSENREVVSLSEAIQRWSEPSSENLVVVTFDDGFSDTATKAFPVLRDLGLPFTLYLATAIVGADDWEGRGTPITWDQVTTMMESGLVTIGAHTHNHVDMRAIEESMAADEIRLSNTTIEEKIGLAPTHFAYPWGYWSKSLAHLVGDTYQSAVLGSRSVRSDADFDPMKLHRFPVQLSDGTRWFRRRLEGGLLFEEVVRRAIHGYDGP